MSYDSSSNHLDSHVDMTQSKAHVDAIVSVDLNTATGYDLIQHVDNTGGQSVYYREGPYVENYGIYNRVAHGEVEDWSDWMDYTDSTLPDGTHTDWEDHGDIWGEHIDKIEHNDSIHSDSVFTTAYDTSNWETVECEVSLFTDTYDAGTVEQTIYIPPDSDLVELFGDIEVTVTDDSWLLNLLRKFLEVKDSW